MAEDITVEEEMAGTVVEGAAQAIPAESAPVILKAINRATATFLSRSRAV